MQRKHLSTTPVYTYAQSCQVVIDLDEILHGVSNGADHAVNDVHNSVGGNLITVDDPGTIHSHHLHKRRTSVLYSPGDFCITAERPILTPLG